MSDDQMIAGTARRASTEWTPEVRDPWMDDALCAQVDPEIFFPDYGQSANNARKVCAGCDVRERCLQFAMEREARFTTNTGRHGVWGGLTPWERAALAAEAADSNRRTA